MFQLAKRTFGIGAAVVVTVLAATACSNNSNPSASDLRTSAAAALAQVPEAPGFQRVSALVGVDEVKVPTPAGTVSLSGPIYAEYQRVGGPSGPLGALHSEQIGPHGGKYAAFEGGVIYWSRNTGAHSVWGAIRTAWEANGGAGGSLGYPAGAEQDVIGGKSLEFSGGKIAWVNGKTTVTLE